MKNKLFVFAAILCASTFAQATPPTKDFLCEDRSGNHIAWDVKNYEIYDSARAVAGVYSDLYLTIDGLKYTLSTDNALATPRQPLLLLQGEESQYAIIKPMGPVRTKGNDIVGSADVEVAVKGPTGLIRKKMRVKCRAFNDV